MKCPRYIREKMESRITWDVFLRKSGDTMKIGFIGAGKVGFSLGKFFTAGGITVTGYFSRHRESAVEAAAFTNTKSYESLATIVKESDALFLTVPDGEITSVYEKLRTCGISGKQICHTSGALSAGEAFPRIQEYGAYGYSIHPLFPVSSKKKSWQELGDAFFCLEGNGPHLSEWKNRLTRLGVKTHIITGSDKVRYHAACAIASNLMCALAQESVELLECCGFSEKNAIQALAPLMKSNLSHIIKDGPVAALTGAAERCDTSTVKKHLDNLQSDEEKSGYISLTLKLAEMAKKKHPDRDYRALEDLLHNYQRRIRT